MTAEPLQGNARLARAAAAGATALGAVVAFRPAFAGGWFGFAAPTGAGAVLVTLVAVLLARVRAASPVVRLAAEVAALAGYVLLVLGPGAALAAGPRRLVTSALPLDPGGVELATVAVAVGLAAIGAAEPALRRANAALPLAAPALAVAAGCAVSAPAGPPERWLAPALALAAGVQFGLAERERHRGAPRLRSLAATVLAVAVLGAAALAGAGVVAGRPAAARDLVPQPVTPRQTTSPLALFPALRTGRLPIELTLDSPAKPQRLRYATLTRFDGTYWTRDAVYLRAGTTLPAGQDTPGRLVTDTVTVVDPGPLGWLVAQGRPVHVSVPGLGVDEETGDLALPADQPVPAQYTVDSVVPGYTDGDVDDAVPARVAGVADPAIPPDLASAAATIAGGAYAAAALHRLADHFARDGGFTLDTGADAPAGHGVFQIRALLRDRRGTAEQYASAFAVLARTLGYDTRVVVGFRTRTEGPRQQVSGRDVDAWPEVRFEGLGWVPFAPTPSTKDSADRQATASARPSPTATGATPGPGATAEAGNGPGGGGAGTGHGAGDGRYGRLPIAAGALAVAAACVLAGSAGLRVIARRRRRRDGDPRRRLAYAWRDALGSLRAAGVGIGPATTSGHVAAGAAEVLDPEGADLAAALIVLHDRATYADGPVTGAEADEAWRLADGLRRAARARTPRWRRITAAVRPWPGPRARRSAAYSVT